ncbi:MAG: adenosylcobinamide-phosphate synthase CbiB [Alsobacter sp.]
MSATVHATLSLALAALVLEALVGYPQPLYRAIGHPVTWIGRLIGWLDRTFNREEQDFAGRRRAGLMAFAIVLLVAGLAGFGLDRLLSSSLSGFALLAVLAASLPAQRSLHEHVLAVEQALSRDGLDAGRKAVAMIVGRNVAVLDEAGVARAAIESLAENFADGVVAPAFWTAAGGLAGGLLYKATNTADSMIGHRTARHAAFGWAAARFDDLVNLPASRLAGLWLTGAALVLPDASAAGAWRAMRRDAPRHRSPNAGWPEAAMAGALGLSLAGPRVYGSERVEDAYMGDGRREARASDIARALRLYRAACALQLAVLALLVLLLSARG